MDFKVLDSKKSTEVRLGDSVVKINPIQTGRYTTYRLTWYVGDKRFRVTRADKNEAIELAKQKVRHLSRAEGEHTTVEPQRLVYLRECERSVRPYPLHEVCEFFRKFHTIGGPKKTLVEICDEYKVTVESRNLTKEHINTVSTQSKVMKKWFPNQEMQQITSAELERKICDSNYSPYSKKKLTSFYKTLENFARRRRYLPREYETITENVALPSIPKTNYPVFTPDELKRLFIVLKPHEVAYVATMAFGGSRRKECRQMTSEHFDFDEGTAHIDLVIAKKKMPRHLHTPDNLLEWLKVSEIPESGILLSHRKVAAISRDKAKLKSVDLVWRQNILRHSFLSYHVAKHENPGITAHVGGTSVHMLATRYVTLVTKRAAEEWFSINPISVREYAEKEGLTHLITW